MLSLGLLLPCLPAHASVLYLDVTPAAELPSAATLQAAIEQELGIALEPSASPPPGSAVLAVRAAEVGRAAVSFRAPDGRTVGRTIALPADPQRAAETLALLAANLVRNEAYELLEGWRQASARAPPAPTPRPVDPALTEVPLALDALPGFGWPLWSLQPERRHLSLGLLGTASAELDGIALAPLFHLHLHRARGLQLSGTLNIVLGPLAGLQVAGGLNLALDDVHGAQVGVVNLANGEVHGAQVGLFNLATRRVSGVQIGLLNLAESADVGIGLLSIYWRGRTDLELLAQDRAWSLDLKHGSRFVHQIVALGARSEAGSWHPQVGLGLGGRVPLGDRVHVDLDVLESLSSGRFDGTSTLAWQTQGRVQVGFRLLGSLGVFAGASYQVTSAMRTLRVPVTTAAGDPAIDMMGSRTMRGLTVVENGPGWIVGVGLF
jgi:hypothetical protein